jgi:hypothetical protein
MMIAGKRQNFYSAIGLIQSVIFTVIFTVIVITQSAGAHHGFVR